LPDVGLSEAVDDLMGTPPPESPPLAPPEPWPAAPPEPTLPPLPVLPPSPEEPPAPSIPATPVHPTPPTNKAVIRKRQDRLIRMGLLEGYCTIDG
jgi:hypothetical protein